jgi:nucleotide-binding universal stress UspA family protein
MENVQYEVVEADDVRSAIIKFAEQKNIDIIVMGTRGLGRIAKYDTTVTLY